MARLKITQVKSRIGATAQQRKNLDALGLRKIGNETVQPDNAATRGKIKKISHLVSWTEA